MSYYNKHFQVFASDRRDITMKWNSDLKRASTHGGKLPMLSLIPPPLFETDVPVQLSASPRTIKNYDELMEPEPRTTSFKLPGTAAQCRPLGINTPRSLMIVHSGPGWVRKLTTETSRPDAGACSFAFAILWHGHRVVISFMGMILAMNIDVNLSYYRVVVLISYLSGQLSQ